MRRSKNSDTSSTNGSFIATCGLPIETDVEQTASLGFVTDAIRRQSALYPERHAVIRGSQSISYHTLKRHSDRVAAELRQRDVGPGALVAIAADSSAESIVAVLAVLNIGAAYVPIDVALPAKRKQFILSDTNAQIILGRHEFSRQFPLAGRNFISIDFASAAETSEVQPSAFELTGREIAYVIYTSGSTGDPKGVTISHHNLRHTNQARIRYYGAHVSRFLLLSPLYFDSSVAGLFWTMTSGGSLILPSDDLHEMPQRLPEFIQRSRVTHLLCIPSLWRRVLGNADPGQLESLETVIVAGEPCPNGLHAEHQRALPDTKLFNEYGPTEGTVWATVARIDNLPPKSNVTIGKPIPGTRVYVVDEQLQPVANLATGELCIAGDGVAQGYLNQPELSAKSFIQPDRKSMDEDRVYRTGDLARILDDGNIELLGRIDHQIKIRGYRIDPAEIESLFCRHRMVEDSVVLPFNGSSGATRLAAFVVPKSAATLTNKRLHRWAQERLPNYMLPDRITLLHELPRNRNGKIDRHSLRDMIGGNPLIPDATMGEDAVANSGKIRSSIVNNVPEGRDALEFHLLNIWSKTLPHAQIDLDTDFFQAGGDSLAAFDLLAQIKQRFGHDLSLSRLLQTKSIRRLAEWIRNKSVVHPSPLVPLKPDGELAPMFMVHPGGGNALCYLELSRWIHTNVPFYGIQAPGFDGRGKPLTTVQQMAETYTAEVLEMQPQGPYRIGGWSFGGIVAYEMARILQQSGKDVDVLAIIDAGILYAFAVLRMLLPEDVPLFHMPALLESMVQGEFLNQCVDAHVVPPQASEEQKARIFELFIMNVNATLEYRPEPYDGKINLLLGSDEFVTVKHNPLREWQRVCTNVDLHSIPGHHFTILQQPNVVALANALNRLLEPATTSDVSSR